MKVSKRQLRQIVRKHLSESLVSESVRASEQFSNSGFISLEDDPYERIEVTSDGTRITIDMDSFKSFLKKADLSSGPLSEAPVRLGPDALERIADARELFGDEEFIERLTTSIPPEILNKAINRMFGDVSAKVRGIQYF
jgi:hypothetical protein